MTGHSPSMIVVFSWVIGFLFMLAPANRSVGGCEKESPFFLPPLAPGFPAVLQVRVYRYPRRLHAGNRLSTRRAYCRRCAELPRSSILRPRHREKFFLHRRAGTHSR